MLLSVPGSHLVDCLDSLLCLWFFHRVIESGGNLLPFGTLTKWSDSARLEHGPRSLTCVQVLGCGNPSA